MGGAAGGLRRVGVDMNSPGEDRTTGDKNGLQTAISPTFPATGLFATPTPFINFGSEGSDERVKKSERLQKWGAAARKNP